MAKAKGTELKLLYDVADTVVEKILRTRDSLFTPGHTVWSDEALQDLHRRFVGNWDTSGESFDAKFRKQLAGAPEVTIQLAGELLFVHFLAGNSTSGEHKRKLINMVLGWMKSPVAVPPDLAAALDVGLAAEGPAFRIHRPFLLQYLLEFVQTWWTLDDSDRTHALDDPWEFKAVALLPSNEERFNVLGSVDAPREYAAFRDALANPDVARMLYYRSGPIFKRAVERSHAFFRGHRSSASAAQLLYSLGRTYLRASQQVRGEQRRYRLLGEEHLKRAAQHSKLSPLCRRKAETILKGLAASPR